MISPEQVIGVCDARFERVYAEWAYKFLVCLGINPLFMDHPDDASSFDDSNEIAFISHDPLVDPVTAIRQDVNYVLGYMKKEPLNNVLLAFDALAYPLQKMLPILREIDEKKRRNDYNLSVSSALSLSFLLEDTAQYFLGQSFLDHSMPHINILKITYTGSKTLLSC